MRTSLLPVGRNFEDLFETFSRDTFNADKMYPPYNTYTEDDTAFIEIAVTGLSKKDIQAYYEDGLLVVEGTYPETERDYSYSGLSKKDFKRKFQIAKNYDVQEIQVQNGLCTISLVENKPETKFLEIL